MISDLNRAEDDVTPPAGAAVPGGWLNLHEHLVHLALGRTGEDGCELSNLLLVETAPSQSCYIGLTLP